MQSAFSRPLKAIHADQQHACRLTARIAQKRGLSNVTSKVYSKLGAPYAHGVVWGVCSSHYVITHGLWSSFRPSNLDKARNLGKIAKHGKIEAVVMPGLLY